VTLGSVGLRWQRGPPPSDPGTVGVFKEKTAGDPRGRFTTKRPPPPLTHDPLPHTSGDGPAASPRQADPCGTTEALDSAAVIPPNCQ
jgi:hypothetical protein